MGSISKTSKMIKGKNTLQVKDIEVDYLNIEVTRKCNERCEHCLRGEAQDINITPEIYYNLFKNITAITNLLITGGEPTLNADGIINILDYIMAKQITVYRFTMYTNGLLFPDKLLFKILDFIVYCEESDLCTVGISNSEWRTTLPNKVLEKRLKLFTFYRDDKDYTKYKVPLINKGLANWNGIGTKVVTIEPKLSPTLYEDQDYVYVETISVTADGYILSDCDYSYDEVEQISVGNILISTLMDIIYEELNSK